VKAAALGAVERRLSGGALHSVDELQRVIRAIHAEHRPHGLRSLDVDVPDEANPSLVVSAAASDPERRTIAWADAFAPDEEARALFERPPRYETNAIVSVNGVRVGSVVASDQHGHAEQNLLRLHWPQVLELVRQNAAQRVRSRVVLGINRAPCHTFCSPALVEAMTAVPAELRRAADFVLAPTGVYEPTQNLTAEEVAAAEQRYRAVADRLRAAGRDIGDYTVLSRAELTEHATRMSDLDALAGAGWDVRQLSVRPRETSAGQVLAEAAHKVAVRAGRVHAGS
jgi:hypothetical protein